MKLGGCEIVQRRAFGLPKTNTVGPFGVREELGNTVDLKIDPALFLNIYFQ